MSEVLSIGEALLGTALWRPAAVGGSDGRVWWRWYGVDDPTSCPVDTRTANSLLINVQRLRDATDEQAAAFVRRFGPAALIVGEPTDGLFCEETEVYRAFGRKVHALLAIMPSLFRGDPARDPALWQDSLAQFTFTRVHGVNGSYAAEFAQREAAYQRARFAQELSEMIADSGARVGVEWGSFEFGAGAHNAGRDVLPGLYFSCNISEAMGFGLRHHAREEVQAGATERFPSPLRAAVAVEILRAARQWWRLALCACGVLMWLQDARGGRGKHYCPDCAEGRKRERNAAYMRGVRARRKGPGEAE